MANIQNLNPIKKGELSKEEAKKRGAAGGKKSGEIRRAKKTMKEMLTYLLQKEIINDDGEESNNQEAISVSLIKQALKGNVKAYEVIRDTIGEKPTDRIDFKDITPEIKVATQEDLEALENLKNANFDKGIS